MNQFPRSRRGARPPLAFALAVAMLGLACTSTTDPDPDQDPTLSLSISPTSASVEQGGSTTFDGTATLGGNFSGTVTIAVTGLPTGVTVTVGSVTTNGNTASATITIDVDGSVAVGSYPGTVTASGSGLTATQTYTLNVTAPPTGSYTMGASPDPISIQTGATGDVTITLTRSNFTGAVTLAAEGLPSGVTAAFSPAAPTGTTSTLTLTVGGGASAGSSTVTVRGTSSLADVTTTFGLTVTQPQQGGFMVDFATCSFDETPIWLAYSDGLNGPWMELTPNGTVYDFSGLTQNVLGVATVTPDGINRDVSVDFFDTSPFSGTVDACQPDGLKTVNGTAANTLGLTYLRLGPALAVTAVDGAFQFAGVTDGPQPFIGYTVDPNGISDRMVVRRDQDIADMGTLGTVDFTAEGFDPDEATITVGGLVGGETGGVGYDYSIMSGGICTVATLNTLALTPTFTQRSAPSAQQMSGEYHVAGVSAISGNKTRSIKQANSTLMDRTLTLPPELPTPTITDVTGSAGYLRLQAEFALPPEYDGVVFFDYDDGFFSSTIFYADALATGNVTLTMPDFGSLPNWDDNWGIFTGATGVNYSLAAGFGEDLLTGYFNSLCTDGGQLVNGTVFGTYN